MAGVVLAGVALAIFGNSPGTEVIGSLNDTELRQIREGVTKEMRQPLFTDASWNGIRGAANELWNRMRTRIRSIERRTDGFVVVFTGTKSDWEGGRGTLWVVFNGTNGWTVRGSYAIAGR